MDDFIADSGTLAHGVMLPKTDLPLKPRDYLLLGLVFEGLTYKQIAERIHVGIETVKGYCKRPEFKAEIERMKQAVYARIMDGEFGTMSMAKAEAPHAMARIIALSKEAKNEKVRFDANVKIMDLAGYQPPKPVVTESPERLIDQMTAEEIDHFIATSEFPERMSQQLARVAAAVLKDRDPINAPPTVEMPTELENDD